MKEKKKKLSKSAKKKKLESKSLGFANEEEEAVFKLRELLKGHILEETTLDSSPVKKKKQVRPQRGEEKIKYKCSDITCWGQRLILCLRRCIACHQWNDAAKLLFALTYQPDRTSEVVWMAGFQIFCNHPNSTPDLLQEFSDAMYAMDKIFRPVIALENMMVCLSRNDFPDAQKALVRVDAYRKIAEDKLNSKQKHILLVMQGYRAMFDYAMWTTVKDEIDQNIQNGEDKNEASEDERDRLAKSAIQLFEALFQQPGVWDIFISKYIAIMEHYGSEEQMINVLQNNCKMNPLHANCYVFLYDALRKYCPNDYQRLSYVLKRLSFVDPSNERILDLLDYWGEKDKLLVLESTFNMLDYRKWKNNNSLWQLLGQLLLSMHRLPLRSEFEKLGVLWEDRAVWWPSYHFEVKHVLVDSVETAELVVNKALTYCSLGGTDNQYTKVVLKKLSQFPNQRASLIKQKRILESLDVSDDDSDKAEESDNISLTRINGKQKNSNEPTTMPENKKTAATDPAKKTKPTPQKNNVLFQLSDESDTSCEIHHAIENCIDSLKSPVKKVKDTNNRESTSSTGETFSTTGKAKKKKRCKDKFDNGTSNCIHSNQSPNMDIRNSQNGIELNKKLMCDVNENSLNSAGKKLKKNRPSNNDPKNYQNVDSRQNCSNDYSPTAEIQRGKKKRKRRRSDNSNVTDSTLDCFTPTRKRAKPNEDAEDFTQENVFGYNSIENALPCPREMSGGSDIKSERNLFDLDVWTQREDHSNKLSRFYKSAKC